MILPAAVDAVATRSLLTLPVCSGEGRTRRGWREVASRWTGASAIIREFFKFTDRKPSPKLDMGVSHTCASHTQVPSQCGWSEACQAMTSH